MSDSSPETYQTASINFKNSIAWLIAIAVLNVLLHSIFNNNYGVHRDELATIDDARHLAWGYVAYPPVTPFIARIALTFFGSSLVGLRFFAALATSTAAVLSGLMARALGGSQFAQILAAVAVVVSPIVIFHGSVFQYVSFDYLCWVSIAYLMILLLRSENPRWWLGIGVLIGIGMLTKYTVAVFVIGVVAGILLTKERRYLKSPWLWAGVGLSLLIWLPNVIWQAGHQFISIDFLQSIHQRDVRIGRTGGFLVEQFYVCANFITVPLWIAGLWFYARHPLGARYRAIAWMFVVPLILLIVLQGRSYYFAPAYPMLLAGGSVLCERWLDSPKTFARFLRPAIPALFLLSGAALSFLLVPIAPVNSAVWKKAVKINEDFREEIGWQDLTDEVANIYNGLPDEEKPKTGILAGNYGEAGAINLYGPGRNLPEAISVVNSYWLRGYPSPPPETVILLGFTEPQANELFEECRVAGENVNQYGVENEESREHPNIFVCRRLLLPWSDFWSKYRRFG